MNEQIRCKCHETLVNGLPDSLDHVGWCIDCGSVVTRVDPNMTMWDTDEDFTRSGINKRVLDQQPLDEMNTLRVFPDQTDQNCYTFPPTMFLPKTLRYVIRAGFFYGNYDGLSNPPTFDLHLKAENGLRLIQLREVRPFITRLCTVYRNQRFLQCARCRQEMERSLLSLPWSLCHCQMFCTHTWILISHSLFWSLESQLGWQRGQVCSFLAFYFWYKGTNN